MDYRGLKEDRKHGHSLMPITCYNYVAVPGIVPMHCHWHSEMEFFRLVKGKLKVQCGSEFFFPKSGDLMFFNSGDLHSAEFSGDEEIFFQSIVFHPDLIGESGIIRAKYISPLLNGTIHISSLLRHNTELGRCFQSLFASTQKREPGYELQIKSLLCQMLYLISGDFIYTENDIRDPSSASIRNVLDFIQENYRDKLTTQRLASLCNMSKGHFCRKFKQYTMRTPVEYINSVRISKAVELLGSTDQKVLEIAFNTGFNNLSYFIEVFRESTGMTPTAFRKSSGLYASAPQTV